MHRRREDPRAFLTSALTIHLPSTKVSFPLHSSQLKLKAPQLHLFSPCCCPCCCCSGAAVMVCGWAFNQGCTDGCFWEAIFPVYCRWIRAPWLVNHWSIWRVRVVENDSPEVWYLESTLFFFPLPRKFGIVSGFVWVPLLPSREEGIHWGREKGGQAGWKGRNRALKIQLAGWEQFPRAACPSLSLVTYVWAAARCQEGRSSWTKRMWLLCSLFCLC